MIVTPGQKAYEKQQEQEDEEGEGEGDDDEEESADTSGQEPAEEKMETSQESWMWSTGECLNPWMKLLIYYCTLKDFEVAFKFLRMQLFQLTLPESSRDKTER